ncbi:transcriptional regulator, IclR family [Dethiosulfatibacter aminovorans DSM 17477]|uniref:Transcriptional regulator, IclR family n=1 Tax=Dethiosulfatibacter aminovorans DSM 17477 TaxID=1121476 RepID=A0A1M6KN91_9FIRM|nr:IclR family transcriptional regulator [Dethiosulfatibacter aminovorans]SHJ60458.1 transcriptional regulator, IclR family [Dethiosulfatibacter aminovorans DSM 17477]
MGKDKEMKPNKDTNTNENEDLNVMVERAAMIMDRIYKSKKPLGVSPLAKELGLAKVTTFRIMKTLEKYNYLKLDPDTMEYSLGYLFYEYSKKIEKNISLINLVTPYMETLVNKVNENVNLSIMYKDKILTIKTVEGDSFALMSVLEPLAPLHCSSSGKLFLSRWTDERIKDYFENEERIEYTHFTITKYETFLKEMKKILREGISYDREEYSYGLTCISAPLFDRNKNIIAVLGISGPTNRLLYKGLESMEKEVKDAANEANEFLKKFSPEILKLKNTL